jgi:hypothetical protein
MKMSIKEIEILRSNLFRNKPINYQSFDKLFNYMFYLINKNGKKNKNLRNNFSSHSSQNYNNY